MLDKEGAYASEGFNGTPSKVFAKVSLKLLHHFIFYLCDCKKGRWFNRDFLGLNSSKNIAYFVPKVTPFPLEEREYACGVKIFMLAYYSLRRSTDMNGIWKIFFKFGTVIWIASC